MVLLGTIFVLVLITASMAESSATWSIGISGPDGNITIGPEDLNSIVSEKGVQVEIDGKEYQGASLWRVLALADAEKTLGPGDIITISGETSLEVPYQFINKNDGYLLVDMGSDSYLYVSPEVTGSSVSGVTDIGVSTTDDWNLLIKTPDNELEISKATWEDIKKESASEKDTEQGTFSGIMISDLLASQDLSPKAGSAIKITGQDGYAVEIPCEIIADSSDYLLADQVNGTALPKYIVGLYGPDVKTPAWPLIQVDSEFPGENSVGNIATLEITS